MSPRTRSWKRVMEEIKKCDPVCVNCHRKLHKRETESFKYLEDSDNRGIQRKRENIRWFQEYKSTLECEKCGENESCCIDFHHQRDKKIEISEHARHGLSRKRLLEEIEKCKVLCANCHREEHCK